MGWPKSPRPHIEGEGEKNNAQDEPRYAHSFERRIVWQANLADKIHSRQEDDDYPCGQDKGACEDAQSPYEIGVAEKLEGGGHFEEAHAHFHCIKPAAALGHLGEVLRKECKKEEGQGESSREEEHADAGPEPVTLNCPHQKQTDKL